MASVSYYLHQFQLGVAMASDPLDVEKTVRVEGRGSSGEGAYTLTPGQDLGQYKIIRPLGRGGMGEVYEAEHQVLRKHFALKLLSPDLMARPEAVARFKREAEVMAGLDHPNILGVDEFGDTDGRYWLRMALAGASGDTHSLEDLARRQGGRLDTETWRHAMVHVLTGLVYAHKRGVVHRDLKPSNILLTDAGDGTYSLAITDFGLARLVGEEWLRSRIEQSVRLSMSLGELKTMPGQDATSAGSSTRSLLGTYEYMSPEQKRGEEASEKSDVYAIGMMGYRLLTGRTPTLKKPSELISDLDKAWDDWITDCLEEDPADRPAARELLGRVPGSTAPPHSVREESPPVKASAALSASPASLAGPVEGQNWTSPATGMEFIWIEAMGLWVGKYAVTNAEYRCKEQGHDSGSYEKHSLNGDRQPVVLVNFSDAKGYAEWLTAQDRSSASVRYRLPTPDEFMVCAQCGDGREYPWGDAWPPTSFNAGNYADQSASSLLGGYVIKDYEDGQPVTAPVEKSWKNPWGLYGVGGNVWETCAADSSCSSFGEWKGGSWCDCYEIYLKCQSRYILSGLFRRENLGFRLVLAG